MTTTPTTTEVPYDSPGTTEPESTTTTAPTTTTVAPTTTPASTFPAIVWAPVTTLELGGDVCMDDGTTRWSFEPCTTALVSTGTPLPATGIAATDIINVGLILLAVGVLIKFWPRNHKETP